MWKRFLMVLAGLVALFIVGYLVMLFMFTYEPTPDKRDVATMVSDRDLVEFGEVEGAFLLTPRNYGYFNDYRIFIVEQYLDKGGDYGDRYVVIDKGLELTEEDEEAINQIRAQEGFRDGYPEELQVLSKHRMRVYKDDEQVIEDWLYKITYKNDGDSFLTFMLPENDGQDRFNFFTSGYDQFLQF